MSGQPRFSPYLFDGPRVDLENFQASGWASPWEAANPEAEISMTGFEASHYLLSQRYVQVPS